MDKKIKLNAVLSGVAGEYLCAGELSRRGYIASITLRNTKGVDILATNEDASKSVAIQVKTKYGSGSEWILGEKAEDYYADNLFYVLVTLNYGAPAEFYVVPSKVVAGFVKKNHQNYLRAPGRNGRLHKDNPMRVFRDAEKAYLGRWELLGL